MDWTTNNTWGVYIPTQEEIEMNYLQNHLEETLDMNLTEKYIQKLKEKELVYKQGEECSNETVFIKDAIEVLRQFEAELVNQLLQTDMNY